MESRWIYELIGYAASLLVAASLTMRSILRLRVINLAGALFFTAYGLLIQAYPVAAVNFFIVLINLYYLAQMLRTKEYFRLLEVKPDSEYLQYFLTHHAADIRTFQPGFSMGSASQLAFFILRNMVPAGLVIGEMRGGSLYLQLDYAIPGYRDLKMGNFLFQDQAQALRERGIQKVYSEPGSPSHTRYLRKMGFQPETDPQGRVWYCLRLGGRP